MSDLHFLFEEPTVPFRSVMRKGALRYIASNKRGSLGAIARFAPPTKRVPKLLMSLLGVVDFRVPRFVEAIGISTAFLNQISEVLDIPVERIGLYVGESNDQQKLVIIDVAGSSDYILKMAAGSEADQAIEREAEGIQRVLDAGCWTLGIPVVRRVENICGKPALLIERIEGRQLTPDEFEAAFFKEDIPHKDTEGTKIMAVEEWLHAVGLFSDGKNSVSSVDSVRDTLKRCRECGALDLRSPLGIVHGDFAPWNIIRRSTSDLRPLTSDLCAIDWEFSRADTPLIFDYAYAAWNFSELLGRSSSSIDSKHWKQLVALGALWKELRVLAAGS